MLGLTQGLAKCGSYGDVSVRHSGQYNLVCLYWYSILHIWVHAGWYCPFEYI